MHPPMMRRLGITIHSTGGRRVLQIHHGTRCGYDPGMVNSTIPATITVPGRGTVRVDPDVATIRFGAVVVRPTAGDARSAAAATMQAVIDALTGGGVDRRDLQTTLVGLDTVREYQPRRRVGGDRLPAHEHDRGNRPADRYGRRAHRRRAGRGCDQHGRACVPARRPDGGPGGGAAAGGLRRPCPRDRRSPPRPRVGLGPVVAIIEGGALPPGPPRPMAEARMKLAADVSTPVEAGTNDLEIGLTVTFAID